MQERHTPPLQQTKRQTGTLHKEFASQTTRTTTTHTLKHPPPPPPPKKKKEEEKRRKKEEEEEAKQQTTTSPKNNYKHNNRKHHHHNMNDRNKPMHQTDNQRKRMESIDSNPFPCPINRTELVVSERVGEKHWRPKDFPEKK